MLPPLSDAVPQALYDPLRSLSDQCDAINAQKTALLSRLDDAEAILKMTVYQLKRLSSIVEPKPPAKPPVAPKPPVEDAPVEDAPVEEAPVVVAPKEPVAKASAKRKV